MGLKKKKENGNREKAILPTPTPKPKERVNIKGRLFCTFGVRVGVSGFFNLFYFIFF